jgi:hypothetical protein
MHPALPPRAPWPPDFPNVIIHGEEKVRDANPDYHAAKSGDAEAALRLAMAMVDDTALTQLKQLITKTDAVLLPVSADEAFGFNAIPDALAMYLRALIGINVHDGKVLQINKVAHTRAPAFQRIITPAAFAGRIDPGKAFIIVDDHVGFGGTLANLIGYVQACGGRCVGATCLTASPASAHLPVSQTTLSMLYARYGNDIKPFWITRFGYGPECFTEREAVVVARQPSLDALEALLARATTEVRSRGL